MYNPSRRIGSTPFPHTLVTKLTYVCRFTLSPTAADTLTAKNFVCNGLYQPESTPGARAHQPMNFDQIILLYNHYEVLGSKIVVDFQGVPTSVSTGNQIVGIHINDDATIMGNNFDRLLENGSTAWTTLTDEIAKKRLTMKWSQKRVLGPNVRGNDNVKGNAIANPVEQSIFAVYTLANDPTVVADSVVCVARITYVARFTERKDMIQS